MEDVQIGRRCVKVHEKSDLDVLAFLGQNFVHQFLIEHHHVERLNLNRLHESFVVQLISWICDFCKAITAALWVVIVRTRSAPNKLRLCSLVKPAPVHITVCLKRTDVSVHVLCTRRLSRKTVHHAVEAHCYIHVGVKQLQLQSSCKNLFSPDPHLWVVEKSRVINRCKSSKRTRETFELHSVLHNRVKFFLCVELVGPKT